MEFCLKKRPFDTGVPNASERFYCVMSFLLAAKIHILCTEDLRLFLHISPFREDILLLSNDLMKIYT
jgi:hypothetical protein